MRFLNAFLLFSILAFLMGCTKKNDVPVISQIIAGDSTGQYIRHVNVKKSIPSFNDVCTLDIDNDQTNDLTFRYWLQHGDPIINSEIFDVSPATTGVYVAIDNKGYPLVLKVGDTISDRLKWSDMSGQILWLDGTCGSPANSYHCQSGNWNNSSGGYLGFKIIKKTQTIWGWVWIMGNTRYIRDYSYTED